MDNKLNSFEKSPLIKMNKGARLVKSSFFDESDI